MAYESGERIAGAQNAQLLANEITACAGKAQSIVTQLVSGAGETLAVSGFNALLFALAAATATAEAQRAKLIEDMQD